MTDDKKGTATDMATVAIVNVAPTVSAVSDLTVNEDAPFTVILADFADQGWLGTHTATIDWGDGMVDGGLVDEDAGNGTVSCSHTYMNGGIYTVTVTVTDDDGGTGSDTLNVLVNRLPVAVLTLSIKR
ncbi:MAG: PKD domain-containing protein [Candidatus Bathyarchaeia archaeon]